MFEAVHAIMHLFRAQSLRAATGSLENTMTHMEYKTLAYFARRPGATQRDLVQHSGRDKAQVARLVQGLREQGLIDARADAADRRSTRLYLTAEGRKMADNMHSLRETLAIRAMSGFSDAERDQLAALLARVHANLRDEAKPDQASP